MTRMHKNLFKKLELVEKVKSIPMQFFPSNRHKITVLIIVLLEFSRGFKMRTKIYADKYQICCLDL